MLKWVRVRHTGNPWRLRNSSTGLGPIRGLLKWAHQGRIQPLGPGLHTRGIVLDGAIQIVDWSLPERGGFDRRGLTGRRKIIDGNVHTRAASRLDRPLHRLKNRSHTLGTFSAVVHDAHSLIRPIIGAFEG
jgi:hypothetical protein